MAWATLLAATALPRLWIQIQFSNISREDYLGDYPQQIDRLTDRRLALTAGTILVTAVAAICMVRWLRAERRIWALLTGLLIVVAADVGATVIVVGEGSPGLLALELFVGLIGLVTAAVAAFSRPRPRRTLASPG